ncbi:MAG: phosphoglucosamine mutase [Deltaproteobacteria bacterium]|nr:phosphoglucosamine mutase [Deltaproteobacteria bacterium]
MTEERRYFGTDGIRGVAGVPPLDPESLVRLGRAVAHTFMGEKGRRSILIGKDTRLSGYMIETSLAAGITAMGARVELCGPIPTPGVAYLTRSMLVDAGIMISASHNPFEDNGIKIFGADGYKLPDSVEVSIEEMMAPGVLDKAGADSTSIGKAHRIDDAIGRYTVYLKSTFSRSLSLQGLKIGFDCANGAGYIVAPQTCEELGADVVARGISPNGRNINAGFGSLYPEIVRKLVREQNLDVGICLDGDADRAILVDDKGGLVDGDMVLALCAIDYKERGKLTKNKVVATVMSNLGLDKLMQRHGIEVVRAQVGDRYVLEQMRKEGLILGGEQSGHAIFGEFSTTGDGILTALQVLEIMVRKQKPLSELVSEFVRFPQKLINIKVSSKPPFNEVPEIKAVIEQKEAELGDSGRILVRYSGTENKARVMVECEDADLCKQHASEVAQVIERTIGAV